DHRDGRRSSSVQRHPSVPGWKRARQSLDEPRDGVARRRCRPRSLGDLPWIGTRIGESHGVQADKGAEMRYRTVTLVVVAMCLSTSGVWATLNPKTGDLTSLAPSPEAIVGEWACPNLS